ncbi:hypothetical protein [Halorubrum sp. DTA98]|uniref:hypothetical protein n=1 Tax=Halorubrum sp. DTA98 TaxID=3402163 RepID=UPI003AADE8D2
MNRDDPDDDADGDHARRRDPFDELAASDDPDDESGSVADVFADLDTTGPESDESGPGLDEADREPGSDGGPWSGSDDGPDEGPWSGSGSDDGPDEGSWSGAGSDDADPFADPFADLDELSDDVGAGSDADGTLDDVFERMEVDELSDDDVWDALDGNVTFGGEATTIDPDGPDHVVDKRKYCQRCPHFSAPPDTTCTHEDGTIVEVVDTDEFRVRGCPMVSEGGPRFDR